eukprot:m.227971 g.227971  ORF g.227971 m.227971 type:complete len:92 (-) comp26420_c0_seq5:701-976(-)
MHNSVTNRTWPGPTDDGKETNKTSVCETVTKPNSDHVRCNYAAEIEFLDMHFSTILSELRFQGVLENTLVVISSGMYVEVVSSTLPLKPLF